MTMFRKRLTSSLISLLLMFAVLSPVSNLYSQDLVASEEIGGGSSVFVFRESARKPQVKAAAGGGGIARAARGGGSRKRIDSTYVAMRRKRTVTRTGQTTAKGPAPAAKIKLSQTLTAKADGEMTAGQIDLAVTSYREALKNNPKNAAASNGLSDALTAKGIDASGPNNTEAGVAYLEEAVKLDAKNEVAYAKLGEIFVAGQQTERGIQNYEKALVAKPDFSDVYVPIG